MAVRKMLAMLATALLLVTAACAGGNHSGGPTAADTSGTQTQAQTQTQTQTEQKLEPIKFRVFVGSPDPGSPPEEDPIHKYIREELGVDIEIIYSPGDPIQKLNLMLASGDYPDAISVKPGEEMKAYANGGHLIPLDDYLEKYAPELKARMDAFRHHYTAAFGDDKYWYVPGGFGYSKEHPLIMPMIGIRFDLWKEQGFPKLETTEDLYEFAKKAQDAHPEVDGKKAYAFSAWFGDWGFWAYHAMYNLGGVNGWLQPHDLNNKGLITWVPFSEEFIYIAKFLNRAYREGYADPEGAVQKHDQYMQKLNDGRIYVNYYGGDWMDGVANRSRIAAGKPEQRFFPYPWLRLPGYEGEPITGQYWPIGQGFGLFFTKNAKNVEELVKRLAPLWTEEGNVITGMGLEGVHWTYDEEGFRKPNAELIEIARTDPNWSDKTGIGKYRSVVGGNIDGFDSKGDALYLPENKYYLESTYDEIDKEIFRQLNITSYTDLPKVGMTKVDWWLGGVTEFSANSKEAMTWQKMNDTVMEYLPKLYLANSEQQFEEILRQFQEDNIKLGYKEIEDIINQRILENYEKYKDILDKY